MNIKAVIDHFGGIANTARALGITYQAVQQWVKAGQIPKGRQWEIQGITKGQLSVCEDSAA